MSANYGWIITKDRIANPKEFDWDKPAVGVAGPRDIAPRTLAALKDGQGWGFRLLDDDGNVYYEGRYIGPDSEEMAGPLDDFGAPNAGCTSAQYWYGRGMHAVADADFEGRTGWRTVIG